MCSDALHIHIGNKITGAEPIFAIASFALPVVDHVKDLHVIIDEKLKFHLHINHVVASAFTRANLILKCFTSRHVQTLLRAFKTYALPVIKPQLAIARLRLHASMMSICLSVCLSVCRQNAKNAIFSKTKQFRAMTTHRKSYMGFSKNPLRDP